MRRDDPLRVRPTTEPPARRLPMDTAKTLRSTQRPVRPTVGFPDASRPPVPRNTRGFCGVVVGRRNFVMPLSCSLALLPDQVVFCIRNQEQQ